MNFDEAVRARYSCRAFRTDQPVDRQTVEELLDIASHAPSGGNLQPWNIIALSGKPLASLVSDVTASFAELPRGEGGEYRIYPENLKEPYFTRRHKCGEDLYATIGVERGDKPGRMKQFRRNIEMFSAPVGLFVYLDRQMQPGQWSDAGMFIQTLMLAATERGLATCGQEFWSMWHKSVAQYTKPPQDWMLFCGIALGVPDADAVVNSLKTDRAPVSEFARFTGF